MSALAVTLVVAGEDKKSGPIGLAVILALCVICYFLFKSMSRHLRKVREEFPEGRPADPPSIPAAAPPEGGATSAPTTSSEPDP